mmetsp:Transcript_6263/g.22401  ORF Transcript_6263/g.22401 Transcript_6263/m.22401 type:complete len:260 (-) Transcript_6263:53-832(-)
MNNDGDDGDWVEDGRTEDAGVLGGAGGDRAWTPGHPEASSRQPADRESELQAAGVVLSQANVTWTESASPREKAPGVSAGSPPVSGRNGEQARRRRPNHSVRALPAPLARRPPVRQVLLQRVSAGLRPPGASAAAHQGLLHPALRIAHRILRIVLRRGAELQLLAVRAFPGHANHFAGHPAHCAQPDRELPPEGRPKVGAVPSVPDKQLQLCVLVLADLFPLRLCRQPCWRASQASRSRRRRGQASHVGPDREVGGCRA